MRILLQDPGGKGYYDGSSWMAMEDRAQEFDTVAQAEEFCHQQQVTKAFIVVKFNDPAQDIRYPIGPQGALLVSRPPTTRISRVA